jgi:hypothetical protein
MDVISNSIMNLVKIIYVNISIINDDLILKALDLNIENT